jgi:Holliday junction DNA helicase RuvA
MIASLQGEVSEKLIDRIILDVNGVGYGVYISQEDYGHINTGDTIKAYIYEHVREQSYDLFGFINKPTLNLFEQLLGVNGVGPKMAINVLSIGNAQEVKQAIAGGDVKYIQKANGVGRRVAERVVVDLKDKLGLVAADLEAQGLFMPSELIVNDEATEALISLGYTANDAAVALKNIDTSLSTEDRVKLALTERK